MSKKYVTKYLLKSMTTELEEEFIADIYLGNITELEYNKYFAKYFWLEKGIQNIWQLYLSNSTETLKGISIKNIENFLIQSWTFKKVKHEDFYYYSIKNNHINGSNLANFNYYLLVKFSLLEKATLSDTKVAKDFVNYLYYGNGYCCGTKEDLVEETEGDKLQIFLENYFDEGSLENINLVSEIQRILGEEYENSNNRT